MTLPEAFLARPIAHRGLHRGDTPENSRAAVRAALEAGYGIEIDLQPSADGRAMVFHDVDLRRMTGQGGPIAQRDSEALGRLVLGGVEEGVPTFAEILGIVGGRVPLLVEIKDQDGALGPAVGALEEAAARDAEGYEGPLAFMSFNPHSVAAMRELAPQVPRGLITCAFAQADWPTLPAEVRDRLGGIPDFERTGASFVSHQAEDLERPRIGKLKGRGATILTWTIRSPEDEARARGVADNITFEGYDPA